jgi:hypothetical protein
MLCSALSNILIKDETIGEKTIKVWNEICERRGGQFEAAAGGKQAARGKGQPTQENHGRRSEKGRGTEEQGKRAAEIVP